jgi:hypothetical protein
MRKESPNSVAEQWLAGSEGAAAAHLNVEKYRRKGECFCR